MSLPFEGLYSPIPQAERSENGLDIDAPLTPTDPITSKLVETRIRWIHFILGCSVLLPWNAIITAMPFFLSRLANSPLRPTFSSYLTTSFTAANFIFLAHATATVKTTIASSQTRSSIIWLTILNFFLTLSTYFVPSPRIFFAFVLFNSAAQATAGAYLQTSVIAVASLFGPPAVQSMMAGQAAVAVVVSGVQVISSAASVVGKPRTYISDGSAEEQSAFTFLALSTVFLLVSAGVHAWLIRMPIYKVVAFSLESKSKNEADVVQEDEGRELIPSGSTALQSDKANVIRVAKINVVYGVAVAYVLLITLAVFPPITTSIRPTNPNTHPLLFTAIHFLVFNIGDFLGRYICSFPKLLVWSANRLLALSLARTLFIPLFLMCNVQRGSTTVEYNPIISSDLLFMVILCLFGWSNGYVSSLCLMSASSLEHNPRLKGRAEDVDVAATVASFCLVAGLALGSLFSFAVEAMICGCNPFSK
ncbi:hypothetical protein BYT27DRAFT_7109304 [Phlegmacium glaucopus]|nr:hypothetical protein BYT27DRAFT_7109304 [Phlegmacium glaucopus]